MRCDGQGVCALIAPEIFQLDRYGDAYVSPGAEALVAEDDELRQRALEADAMCPRNAIYELPAAPERPPRLVESPSSATTPARLVLEGKETVAEWRARGGWRQSLGHEVLDTVAAAGLVGHGGAGFPTATKLRGLVGVKEAVVVLNGAEREPGTLKDRYLLAHRPGLLLDGLQHILNVTSASEAVITVDEESVVEYDTMATALDEAREAGFFQNVTVRMQRVPTRYVAGEETALISVLAGGPPLPRMRPPLPSESGLNGRPTLVQNAETVAQVALALQLGADEFRSVGTPDTPGTGIFSVGPFGGPYEVVERPYGYPLQALLSDLGLLDDARAVLVGGYAGGLLSTDAGLDVALAPNALAERGASLGTKAVHVIGRQQCPVGVVAGIVGFFGDESAQQCPPCARGLPDSARMLRALEDGTADQAMLDELGHFMATLHDRGICRLPDGAARMTQSLLSAFSDDVAAHLENGCPHR